MCYLEEIITMKPSKVGALNEKILVVDDDTNICDVLKMRLTKLGYTVLLAADGIEALSVYREFSPTLIILDVMLPKLDGYEVCSEIRKESQIPIIMLTALDDISERVMGFELGADDYVIKPFSPKELEARIQAVLRRCSDRQEPGTFPEDSTLSVGSLSLNFTKRQVFRGKTRVKLTGLEFNLLELLIANAGQSLSRTIILDNIWGYTPERYVDTRVVDVHISRLRAKLEEDPSNPDLILTARGMGYMFPKYKEN